MPDIRISLNEEQFRQLVAGKEVEIGSGWTWEPTITVRLILSDIGYHAMDEAIPDASRMGLRRP
jgi:hypothetical protein